MAKNCTSFTVGMGTDDEETLDTIWDEAIVIPPGTVVWLEGKALSYAKYVSEGTEIHAGNERICADVALRPFSDEAALGGSE